MEETLRQALEAADEAYLTGMSNKGLYKRACRDIENAQVQVQETAGEMEVSIGGEVCRITVPLWESSCSCPSQTTCRHLLGAILWLRQHLPESEDTEEYPEEEPYPPEETPAPPSLSMELKAEMEAVSISKIRAALGTFQKQLPEYISRIYLAESSILTGFFPDGTKVNLLSPLAASSCTCRNPGLCAHKAAVLLAFRIQTGSASLEDFIPEEPPIPEEETAKIRDCAVQSRTLLEDVLRWGLVRMPESLSENLEIAAVRCHSLKMADGERALRDIGGRLTDCREKRAAFQPEQFLQKFCRCSRLLQDLQKDGLTEKDLGTFRENYVSYSGELTILPVGQRSVRTAGYAGEVYYFLNMDESAEQRFLSFSDLRPTFYDGGPVRTKTANPWGMAAPLKRLMRSEMVLQNAKICGGKLSSSAETELVYHSNANLNCREVKNLVYTDFCRLAIHLSEFPPRNELDKLCFVRPSRILGSHFDEFAQEYTMTIADRNGCRIRVRLRYTAKDSALIDLLEKIGEKMSADPTGNYLLFAAASLENGELTLMPIDFYDFVLADILPDKDWTLPEEYAVPEKTGWYIREILDLFAETEGLLCELLQSGLQSAYGWNDSLSDHARRIGLDGFSQRIRELTDSIRRQRHSLHKDCTAVLNGLTDVYAYLQAGRKKLSGKSALFNMKVSDEI